LLFLLAALRLPAQVWQWSVAPPDALSGKTGSPSRAFVHELT
jgi:hypothetical protein